MPGLIRKVGVVTALFILAVTVAPPATAQQGGTTTPRAASTVYFEFTDITRELFVFGLDDPDKIRHARDIIEGRETSDVHVMGRIVKRPAPYNRPWSYHLAPRTIDFFGNAFEVCDATIVEVEEHLDEAGGSFLPGLTWCPWTSELVREVDTP